MTEIECFLTKDNMFDFMIEAASSMVFHYMDTKTGARWEKSTILMLSPEVLCNYNLTYAIDDGRIVVAVYDGKIYVAPDFIWWEAVLQKKGFHEEQIMLEMPANNTINRWLEQYDKLLFKFQYHFNLETKKAVREAFLERGIDSISEHLLSHCLRIPDYGIEFTRTSAADGHVGARNDGYSLTEAGMNTVKYYPKKVTKTGRLQIQSKDVGRYGFHDGIVVFVHVNGCTYASPDPEVVEALEEAGYTHATFTYVPFANGEKIISPDIEREWNELRKKYAPELTFCWAKRGGSYYPRIIPKQ